MATYRDMLDQLTTAVAVVDAADDGAFHVTYLNHSAEALFGRSRDRARGLALSELLADAHATPAALQAVLDTGCPFTKREVALAVREGVARVNYSIAPLSASELLVEFERLDRFVRIHKDERHATSQETMRELARGLAHEIKNPLGGIRGAAQLLERQLSDAEREYTSVIIAEADRLRKLVDRMLGPREALRFAPVNVHHVIERVVQLVRAEAAAPIVFERDYDPSLPEIQADFEQLVQAALHVLGNAAVALRDVSAPVLRLRTRVVRQFTIGARRHRLVVNVDFIDNGPGVPPEIAERIFFPMISGWTEGAGLGLAITQAILARHDGLVECESEPGRTVFSFYLPVCPARAEAGAAVAAGDANGT